MIVTVCDRAKESCPILKGKKTIHYNLNDPAQSQGTIDKQLEVYRSVRNEIRVLVQDLLNNYERICQEPN